MMNRFSQRYAQIFKAIFFTAISTIIICSPSLLRADGITEINNTIEKTLSEFNSSQQAISIQNPDQISLNSEISSGLEYARSSLAQGNIDLALDTLYMTKGLLNTNIQIIDAAKVSKVDKSTPPSETELGDTPKETVLKLNEADLKNVEKVLGRMNTKNISQAVVSERSIDRLSGVGYNLDRVKRTLGRLGISMGDLTKNISLDANNLTKVHAMVNKLNSNPSALRNIEKQLAQAAKSVGASLNDVATTVAFAIQAGVKVNLNSVSKGMGFNNFASAVKAYNAANGTNYTTKSAREALGQ